jgi:hypothetical protein
VLGPHFEGLCRWWTSTHASRETLGGRPARVASGVVNDARDRAAHEIDVIAVDADGRILCLGEAKLGAVMGQAQLARLARARELLAAAGVDATGARLMCFSGAGFTPELHAAQEAGAVSLVDLARLYTGS